MRQGVEMTVVVYLLTTLGIVVAAFAIWVLVTEDEWPGGSMWG